MEIGLFCQVFGNDTKTRYMEEIITIREFEFSIYTIMAAIEISQTTVNKITQEFLNKKYIVPTIISTYSEVGKPAQLYILNGDNKDIKELIKVYDNLINNGVN